MPQYTPFIVTTFFGRWPENTKPYKTMTTSFGSFEKAVSHIYEEGQGTIDLEYDEVWHYDEPHEWVYWLEEEEYIAGQPAGIKSRWLFNKHGLMIDKELNLNSGGNQPLRRIEDIRFQAGDPVVILDLNKRDSRSGVVIDTAMTADTYEKHRMKYPDIRDADRGKYYIATDSGIAGYYSPTTVIAPFDEHKELSPELYRIYKSFRK